MEIVLLRERTLQHLLTVPRLLWFGYHLRRIVILTERPLTHDRPQLLLFTGGGHEAGSARNPRIARLQGKSRVGAST